MKNTTRLFTAILISIFSSGAQAQWDTIRTFPYYTDGCCSFVIGNTAYIGGGAIVGGAGNEFYRYDSAANSWVPKAALTGGHRRAYGFAFTLNGKGFAGGGDSTNYGYLVSDFWQYDTAADVWTRKADFGGGKREGAIAFVINDTAYVGGGTDGSKTPRSDFWKYNAAADTWIRLDSLPMAGTLYSAAIVVGGNAYVCTGSAGSFSGTAQVWEYTPASGAWARKSDFPGSPRQGANTFVVGGVGYLCGGFQDTTNFVDVWAYNPAGDKWTLLSGNLPYLATAWTTCFVLGNTVYFGDGGLVNSSNDYITDKFYKHSFPANAIAEKSLPTMSISVFPNPVRDIVHISFNGNSDARSLLSVVDMSGKIVIKQPFYGNTQLNLSGLQGGFYLLRLQTGLNQVETVTSKIVKE